MSSSNNVFIVRIFDVHFIYFVDLEFSNNQTWKVRESHGIFFSKLCMDPVKGPNATFDHAIGPNTTFDQVKPAFFLLKFTSLEKCQECTN